MKRISRFHFSYNFLWFIYVFVTGGPRTFSARPYRGGWLVRSFGLQSLGLVEFFFLRFSRCTSIYIYTSIFLHLERPHVHVMRTRVIFFFFFFTFLFAFRSCRNDIADDVSLSLFIFSRAYNRVIDGGSVEKHRSVFGQIGTRRNKGKSCWNVSFGFFRLSKGWWIPGCLSILRNMTKVKEKAPTFVYPVSFKKFLYPAGSDSFFGRRKTTNPSKYSRRASRIRVIFL